MIDKASHHSPTTDAKALQVRRLRQRHGMGQAMAQVLAELRYGEALQWP